MDFLWRVHDFHLAEESSQEAFFYLASHFNKVGDINSPKTKSFVYTVANGFAINKFNKEVAKRHDETIILFSDDIPDDKFDIYNETELKDAYENALTDEEKTYFRLKYAFGYTSAEIGELFGESSSNVRRKMSVIKHKLIERLGAGDE